MMMRHQKPKEVVNIYVISLIMEMRNFNSGNEEVKVAALKSIALLAYGGGASFEQYLLKDPRILDLCMSALNADSRKVRLQGIQCLSTFSQGGINMLEILYQKQVMSILVSKLTDNTDDFRRWVLYAVYVLLVKNFDRYKDQLRNQILIDAVRSTLFEEWDGWRCNPSSRISQLIEVSHE